MAKAKKAKKVRSATPLSPEKVVETIKALPAKFRRYAQKQYRKYASGKMPKRHGSKLFAKRAEAKGKGAPGMTVQERRMTALMKAHGASYRALEEIMGMKPCSGNDAQRQVNRALLVEDTTGKLAKQVIKICKKSGEPIPKACEAAVALAAQAS